MAQDYHALIVMGSIYQRFKAGDFCDMTIISREGFRVKAHKIILIAQCEYLASLFRTEKNRNEVELDIALDIIHLVLDAMYTGNIELTTDNVQDVIEAANYLQIETIVDEGARYIVRNLDDTNCCDVLRLANTLDNDHLKKETVNYIGKNFVSLFNAENGLKTLPPHLFAQCLKSNQIILYSKYGTVLPAIPREEALVKYVIEYIRSHDYETRIKHAETVFKALKLPLIVHQLDLAEAGMPELAKPEDDPALHATFKNCMILKEKDLRQHRLMGCLEFMDTLTGTCLRKFSFQYNIWSERHGYAPSSCYRDIRSFCCEGGPDKFIRSLEFGFRPFDGNFILGGMTITWSNGSKDVAGATQTFNSEGEPEYQTQKVELEDGENIQKVSLRSGWFIMRIQITTNKNRVIGPFGGPSAEMKPTDKRLRYKSGIDPGHVYLDGVRGALVYVQGKPAIHQISLKWSFVMNKKVTRNSYHNALILRDDVPRITVASLEKETNLNLDDSPGHRDETSGYTLRGRSQDYLDGFARGGDYLPGPIFLNDEDDDDWVAHGHIEGLVGEIGEVVLAEGFGIGLQEEHDD